MGEVREMKASDLFPKNQKAATVKAQCDKRNIKITSDKRGGVQLSKSQMREIDFHTSADSEVVK